MHNMNLELELNRGHPDFTPISEDFKTVITHVSEFKTTLDLIHYMRFPLLSVLIKKIFIWNK